MSLLNFFKKKKKSSTAADQAQAGTQANDDDGNKKKKKKAKKPAPKTSGSKLKISDQIDTSQLSRKQRWGLKMFEKLPQKKQEELMRKALDPREVQKNKKEIEAQIDQMVKSGQIHKSQVAAMKSRMGLR